MIIKINDGRKTYEIQNQDGEVIASVTFKPSDSNILRKADSVAEELERIIRSIKDIPTTSSALIQKEDEVKEKINELFSSDVTTPFFDILGAFSPIGGGKLFVEEVFEKLIGIVRDEYEQLGKENEKMDEYLKDYTEGESK